VVELLVLFVLQRKVEVKGLEMLFLEDWEGRQLLEVNSADGIELQALPNNLFEVFLSN